MRIDKLRRVSEAVDAVNEKYGRLTLRSGVSMTERAWMLTFSDARAEQILARRPGLFSR